MLYVLVMGKSFPMSTRKGVLTAAMIIKYITGSTAASNNTSPCLSHSDILLRFVPFMVYEGTDVLQILSYLR